MDTPPLTVGDIRKLIAGLPDDAHVYPDWANGPPGDADPAVVVHGAKVGANDGKAYLAILVDVAYLDEFGSGDPDEFDEDEFDDDDNLCPLCNAVPCVCGEDLDEFDGDNDFDPDSDLVEPQR